MVHHSLCSILILQLEATQYSRDSRMLIRIMSVDCLYSFFESGDLQISTNNKIKSTANLLLFLIKLILVLNWKNPDISSRNSLIQFVDLANLVCYFWVCVFDFLLWVFVVLCFPSNLDCRCFDVSLFRCFVVFSWKSKRNKKLRNLFN